MLATTVLFPAVTPRVDQPTVPASEVTRGGVGRIGRAVGCGGVRLSAGIVRAADGVPVAFCTVTVWCPPSSSLQVLREEEAALRSGGFVFSVPVPRGDA